MSPSLPIIVFLGLILYVTAEPVYKSNHLPKLVLPTFKPWNVPKLIHPTYNPINPPIYIRAKRFVSKYDGAQQPQQQNPKGWEIRPDVNRDQRGNTRAQVEVQKHGENHDINAGYGQVFRGPDKHSETWHVGGRINW